MMDISTLEQYFPQVNKPLIFNKYTFTILFQQNENTFLINLKIKQQDTKKEHLIKFRFGIGKDKPQKDASHKTDEPHFEIDIYKREKESFSATIYFTFRDSEDEKMLEYAKGTIVLIDKIIKQFIKHEKLDATIMGKIIYDEAVMEELSQFEPTLINALYDCYKNSDLIVREGNKRIVVKTPHNFRKYLGIDAGINDLNPLFLPLLKKIEKKE
ncbi:MAG: hypothetical protein Q8O89_07265 [Nanoarchaeota archaeon]|nr:hypothetical protein [Nanoarchaeota archaeon]